MSVSFQDTDIKCSAKLEYEPQLSSLILNSIILQLFRTFEVAILQRYRDIVLYLYSLNETWNDPEMLSFVRLYSSSATISRQNLQSVMKILDGSWLMFQICW